MDGTSRGGSESLLAARLLAETVQFQEADRLLILNSAADPFVAQLAHQLCKTGAMTLAEDNVAVAQAVVRLAPAQIVHSAFHTYMLHSPAAAMDVALLDLLYQPGNAWAHYALRVAHYALRLGGRLYVVGAKDRGILSLAKRLQETFGNAETLLISKGHRVLCARKTAESVSEPGPLPGIFAGSQLDEGTRLLIEVLPIQENVEALDIGCGAGFLGLHIARSAPAGQVTMVDVSLGAVDAARQAVEQSGLRNVRVQPSDGAQAVLDQRFDLVVTNPPFHQGGIQTTAIAERFIREAALVLKPRGSFYLVANRFLKYEPALRTHFRTVAEVAGNVRYKVLRAQA